MEYNEGLWQQLKKKPFVNYGRPGNLTARHIALMIIEVMDGYLMGYSGNTVKTEEELDMEIDHFKFLFKYNML